MLSDVTEPAPIDELAALRARKNPAPVEPAKPLVGVREDNGKLCLYFCNGTRSVTVPVTLERAEEHAGDILQLVREIRGNMKPNGRRAWRKWAHYGWGRVYNWRTIRRHPDVGVPQFVPPEPKPRQFTAASLVGMTMGARKRAFAAEFDKLPQHERAGNAVRLVIKYGLGPSQRMRFRPCPGCFRCKPAEVGVCAFCGCDGCGCDPEPCSMCRRVVCAPCVSDGGGASHACPKCSGGLREWQEADGSEICTGSGVLPAKGGGR